MASVSDLNIRLGVAYREFDRSMRQVENRLRQSAQTIGGIADNMMSAISVPILGLGAVAIKAAGDFEALRLALNTTMVDAGYSTQQAAKELEELRKVALAPGIDLEQAVKGSIRLQSVGFSAERARVTLTELANALAASGGNAQQLDGVSRQFAQMASKGKIMQEDLTIILENMPSLAKVLMQAFGTTNAEAIRNMGVSADEFITKITEGLQKTARVQGGVKNAIDNARSALTQFFVSIGDGINEAYNLNQVAEDLSAWLGRMADAFRNLDPETKKSIINFALYAAAAGPVIKIFSSLFVAGQTLVSGLRVVGGALANLSGSALSLYASFTKLSTAMKFTYIGAAIAAVTLLYAGYQKLTDGIDKAFEAQNMFRDASEEVNKEAAKEIAQSEKLFSVLLDETNSRTTRNAAFDELKRIYPDILGNYDLEKTSLATLKTLQDKLNQSIVNRIATEKKGKLIDTETEKIVEARLKLADIEARGVRAFTSGLKADRLEFWGLAAGETADKVAELKSQIAQSENNIKQFDEQFNRAFGVPPQGIEDSAAKLYELRDAEVDVDAINKKMAASWAGAAKAQNDKIASSKEYKSAVKEEEKALKAYNEILSDVDKTFTFLKITGADAGTALNEQTDAIKKAIDKLLDAGYSPDHPKVKEYLAMLKILKGKTDVGPEKIESPQLPENADNLSLSSGADPALVGMLDVIAAKVEEVPKIVDPAKAAVDGFRDSIREMGEMWSFADFSFQTAKANLVAGMTEMIDSFSKGGEAQQAIFNGVSGAIGKLTDEGSVNMKDYARTAAVESIKIAKAYAVQGIFAAVSKALQSVPFPFNLIAAGVAAGAAGALLNGLANKIAPPKLAKGGLAYGPTLAMVGDNPGAASDPEVISPLSKLKGIMGSAGQMISLNGNFKIRGQDLELVLAKASKTQQRIRGK